MKDLHNFFEDNRQFFQYHWGVNKFLDHIHFVREKSNYRIYLKNICTLNYYKFSTTHDNSVATIIVSEKLTKYIDKEIDVLKYGSFNDTNPLNTTKVSNRNLEK